jgi:hypothetical protein
MTRQQFRAAYRTVRKASRHGNAFGKTLELRVKGIVIRSEYTQTEIASRSCERDREDA